MAVAAAFGLRHNAAMVLLVARKRCARLALRVGVLFSSIGAAASAAHAELPALRCPNPTEAVTVDGITDEWKTAASKKGTSDTGLGLRCSWDGTQLAFAIEVRDEKIVRVPKAKGREDVLVLTIEAGGTPLVITLRPANQLAPSSTAISGGKRSAALRVADSLSEQGFAVEVAIAAASLVGFSANAPAVTVAAAYRDVDTASGAVGSVDTELIDQRAVEFADRGSLFSDFLATVRLKKSDVAFDQLANVDPELAGMERVVIGGTVIGLLTSQYAYVSLPAASPRDVIARGVLPLGKPGQHAIYAVVRQSNGALSRDLLLLFTAWSGQLSPLGSFEIRRQDGKAVLENQYKSVPSPKGGAELHLLAKPQSGFAPETFVASQDEGVDPIVVPWDPARRGVALRVVGAEVARRDLKK